MPYSKKSPIFLAVLLTTIIVNLQHPSTQPNTPEPGVNAPTSQHTVKLSSNYQSILSAKSSEATDATTLPNLTAQVATTIRSTNTKKRDSITTKDGETYPLRTYEALGIPNDPYANQWWTTPNDMSTVWATPFGNRATKIAIIDTGFALDHQEFTDRWATNAGELGATSQENPSARNCTDQAKPLDKSCNNIDDNFDGIVDNETGATTEQNRSFLNCTDQGKALDKSCNRRDDDGNGYIDDYRGWDFNNYDNSPQAGEVNPDGSGTKHGTMTASVLGAIGNNGVGIAGVNWYSQILPLQALDDDSYGDSYTVGEAVRYAADQGVDVISISLGSTSADPYLRQSIQYAMNKGVIIVAASGNDGCNCINYPANYPEVIAVGATDTAGNPASFSNYGTMLDILAPGTSMTTASWSKTNQTAGYVSGASGTSFATPFVGGLLGLAKSYQPNASWDEIIGAMFENADRRTLTQANPRSDTLGLGITRANTMLARLQTAQTPPVRYNFSPTVYGSARLYQCDSNTIPATMIYELSKPNQLRYSTSTYLGQQNSWTAQNLFYSCVGLPTDNPSTLRTLDLISEIHNLRLK